MNTLISDFNKRRKEKGLKPLTPDEENIITKAQINAKELFMNSGIANTIAEISKAQIKLKDIFTKNVTDINKGKDDFDKIKLENLNSLQSRDLLVPTDFDKFYLWLVENYYPDSNVFPRVDVEDFINYSFYYDEFIKEQKRKPKPKGKQVSYVWQGNPDIELPELYTLMVDKYKLFAPETTPEQFEDSFTTDAIENIIPLIWLKTNKLLVYFLDNYFKGQNYQSIAENRKQFSRPNKILLNANDLSVAKNSFQNGLPKGYELIDKIIETTKKLKNIKHS